MPDTRFMTVNKNQSTAYSFFFFLWSSGKDRHKTNNDMNEYMITNSTTCQKERVPLNVLGV